MHVSEALPRWLNDQQMGWLLHLLIAPSIIGLIAARRFSCFEIERQCSLETDLLLDLQNFVLPVNKDLRRDKESPGQTKIEKIYQLRLGLFSYS